SSKAATAAELAVREAEARGTAASRRLESLRNDRERQRVEAERSSSRQHHLFAEIDGFAREISEADQGRAQVELRLAQVAELTAGIEARIAEADKLLQGHLSAETALAQAKAQLEHQRAELTHRRAALDQLDRAHDQG